MGLFEKRRLKQTLKLKLVRLEKRGLVSGLEVAEVWQYLWEYRWPKKQLTSFKERQTDIQNMRISDFFDYQRLQIQMHQKPLAEEDFSDLFS